MSPMESSMHCFGELVAVFFKQAKYSTRDSRLLFGHSASFARMRLLIAFHSA